MITINKPDAHTEYRIGYWELMGSEQFSLLTLCPTSDRSRSQQVGHPPYASRKNFLGNRDCFHANMKGTLTCFKPDAPAQPGDSKNYRRVYTEGKDKQGKQNTCYFSKFSIWGVPVSFEATTEARFNWYKNDYQRAYFEISYPGPNTRLTLYRPYYKKAGSTREVFLALENWERKDDEHWYYSSGQSTITETRLSNGSWPGTIPPMPTLSGNRIIGKSYIYNGQSSAELSAEDLLHIDLFCQRLIPPASRDVWGDLSQVACEQARALDINSIAYVKDLFELKTSVTKVINLMRQKVSAKTLADLELSLKYGVRLTYNDTKEVLKALRRKVSTFKGYSLCRSMSQVACSVTIPGTTQVVNINTRYNLKCYYDAGDGGLKGSLRNLMSADVFPTLQNAWDLIPFSFCLNWFVDVESLLNRIDTNTFISVLNVLSVIRTSRTSMDIDASSIPRLRNLGLSGTFTYVLYDRQNTNHLTVPTFRLDETHGFNNFVELGAIIVQKKH